MRILLIDNGTTLLEKLKVLIPEEEIVCKPEAVHEKDTRDFDLIVLSGSKDFTVTYDEKYFKNEIELIKNTKIPLIGICLGCELIATVFGGTLKRLSERHSGIRKITTTTNNEILSIEKGEAYEVYEGHRWAINVMPKGFTVLAVSEDIPEIIKHDTLPIWGFQFHPENFVDQTAGDEMFLRLFSKIVKNPQ